MTKLLEVRNLTRTFGALNAVAGVSFSVRQGELVGLIGRASCRERVSSVV